ncbi:MAG: ABC-2 family transporter protein [Ardenticatenales bacterium]|nr:ABC-2 family transporter protein [Ardenticatenales bacterium]
MSIFRLAAAHWRVNALNELQYRVNLVVQLFQSLIALATGLIGLSLVFRQTDDLAGWSRPELLAVMGVHLLMGGIIQAVVQPNMQRLMGDVQNGLFDYSLVKPVDAQALSSVRELRIWQVVDVLVGAAVLAVAVVQLDARVGVGQALWFVVALVLGALSIYSFWLILTTGVFWIIRIENIVELFQGVYQAGRWPVGIYPPWLRGGLTFLVPVAFAVTVPSEAMTGRLTPQTMALAFGVAVGLMAVARGVWRLGVRRYGGASA